MPTKKKIATGPKATLMKKNLAQLKAQAKKLKIKGFSTKKKEALVNSIMMAQARNKKGKAKRKTMAEKDYTPTGTRRSIKRMAKKRGAPASRVMRNPAQTGRIRTGSPLPMSRNYTMSGAMGSMVDYANFADFGYRELDMAGDLLTKYANGTMSRMARDYFSGPYGIQVGFNKNSGNVFLVDEDYNVLMDDGKELDLFITTPYSGEEGFYDDLMDIYGELDEEDQEYLDSLK
jgi:hypothetical protein